MFRELTGASAIVWDLFPGAPPISPPDQHLFVGTKLWGKTSLLSVKQREEEQPLSTEELRKFFLPEWLQSVEFQTRQVP